jgi:hypothetical protein
MIRTTVMKIPITVHNPAFIPNKLITSENISSGDVGITNVDNVILDGSANFSILDIALTKNNINKTLETIRACFLKLGKRERIPLPKIAPCNKPIPITTPKVIR